MTFLNLLSENSTKAVMIGYLVESSPFAVDF
jgi:hypothetical protein